MPIVPQLLNKYIILCIIFTHNPFAINQTIGNTNIMLRVMWIAHCNVLVEKVISYYTYY